MNSQASPVAPAAATESENFVTVSGPLIVEHQVEITAQRDGTLAKIRADAGTRVKAGTLLAQLDDRQLNANLEAGRAKSRSIENDLKNWQAEAEVVKFDLIRAQRLWDLGLIPEDQLQHAKFKVESEQWDVKRVSEMLNTSRQEERSAGTGAGKNQNYRAVRLPGGASLRAGRPERGPRRQTFLGNRGGTLAAAVYAA